MSKATGTASEMVLNLEDLLPDDEGNIFISSFDDMQLRIVTHEPVAETGVMPVTGEGAAPETFQYFLFESGTKLLCDEDASLILEILT